MHYLDGQAVPLGTVPELYYTSRAGGDHNFGACFFDGLHLLCLYSQADIPMSNTEGTA
jgi:hypothetical protein